MCIHQNHKLFVTKTRFAHILGSWKAAAGRGKSASGLVGVWARGLAARTSERTGGPAGGQDQILLSLLEIVSLFLY